MSEQTWYYIDSSQQQHGPITIPALQELVASGVVTKETSVWTEALGEQWIPASNVEGLFSVEPAQSASPVAANSSATNPSPALRAAMPATPVEGAKEPERAPTAPMIPSTPTTTAVPAQVVQPEPAQPAPAGVDPYAVPQANLTSGTGDPSIDFPAPVVKKGSPVVYIVARILGAGLIVAAFLMAFRSVSKLKETIVDFQAGEASRSELIQAMHRHDSKAEELAPYILVGLGICLVGGLLSVMLVSKGWACLRHVNGKLTPGSAYLMLIPVFNLYWVFPLYVSLANQWNSITAKFASTQTGPKFSKPLFVAHSVGFVLGTLSLLSLFQMTRLRNNQGIIDMPDYLILGHPYVYMTILLIFSIISIIVACQIAKGVNFIAVLYQNRGNVGVSYGTHSPLGATSQAGVQSQQSNAQQGGGMKFY